MRVRQAGGWRQQGRGRASAAAASWAPGVGTPEAAAVCGVHQAAAWGQELVGVIVVLGGLLGRGSRELAQPRDPSRRCYGRWLPQEAGERPGRLCEQHNLGSAREACWGEKPLQETERLSDGAPPTREN